MRYTKQEQAEAFEALKAELPPGTTVYTILDGASKSGMTRRIRLVKLDPDGPRYLTRATAAMLGYPMREDALVVKGAGMDMGFHVVYSLSRALYPDGFGVRDGGYALTHRWL